MNFFKVLIFFIQGLLRKEGLLFYYLGSQHQRQMLVVWQLKLSFSDVLLPSDRWHLMWKCVWSKGVSLNFSMQKKLHSLTFTDTCWIPKSGCEQREAVGGAFQQWWQRHERQAVFWAAMHSCHTTKWRVPRSAHPRESASAGDYDEK